MWADEQALNAARREYAMHFFSVDAHVGLARELRDNGDPLQAFFTLETARREHFDQDEFTKSFRRIFLGDTFDNSPQAEAALRAKTNASPDDFEAAQKLADIYISRSEWKKAMPLLQRAATLRPGEFSPVSALAEVYERIGEKGKADAARSQWMKEHSESAEALNMRIQELLADEKTIPQARPLLEEALKRYPDDAGLHFNYGVALERAGDFAGTEKEFERAVQLGPKSAEIQAWVARFYLKRKEDPKRALELYLNAYFLNPDFYETEYVESRIRPLAQKVFLSILDTAEKNGALEKNPIPRNLRRVLERSLLDSAEKQWSADAMERMLRIVGSDDEINRWTATRLITEHGDVVPEARLSQLLDGPDLRAQGMAGYILVKQSPDKGLPLMKKRLESPAELLRFDAISALLMYGGPEGRKVVQEYQHSGRETAAGIRRVMAAGLADKPDKKKS